MKGICLKFYTYEREKHKNLLIYEWFMELSKREGFAGCFVVRAIAGFGHQKKIHEERFFELGSNLPIQIQFVLSSKEADKLLEILKNENLHLFYTLSELEYGHI
jgi:PII-like signaling protein